METEARLEALKKAKKSLPFLVHSPMSTKGQLPQLSLRAAVRVICRRLFSSPFPPKKGQLDFLVLTKLIKQIKKKKQTADLTSLTQLDLLSTVIREITLVWQNC